MSRPVPLPWRLLPALLIAILAACGGRTTVTVGGVEATYQEARGLKDTIKATRARNANAAPDGTSLVELVRRYGETRTALVRDLGRIDPSALGEEDRHAFEVMQRAPGIDLGEEKPPPDAPAAAKPDCAYDPAAVAKEGFDPLSERIYACYGQATENLIFEGKTLDRLTVFSLLPITGDRDRRRGLFLSMEPIWKAVNGDGGPGSPWRTLVRLSAARFREKNASIESSAALLGVDPGKVEPWLVSVLEAWRDATAGADLEPWDFGHAAGAMERALTPHIPRESLRPLNDRVYQDLGADPVLLGVEYDIEPRAGKDPVAYTDFAARPRRLPDGGWTTGRYRISASYAVGGPGNLAELLHETGHAVHIAAIRNRPAFLDWPDSDTFTEALAELVALDLYDPEWQQRYLGRSVPGPDALRAKYSGIVMDTAWALFEIRMHRDPSLDPNQVWTDLMRDYLHIRPHLEWSWWAVRGQLIDLPGYMLNYALGAILVADLRARTRELYGARPWGDTTWYPRVSDRLYRFGLERPSRQVIEEYLGRPVSPDALIRDLRGR